jgi:hypothetical protein
MASFDGERKEQVNESRLLISAECWSLNDHEKVIRGGEDLITFEPAWGFPNS